MANKKDKKLINLATGKKSTNTTVVKKEVVVEEKKTTPEENRIMKAKETVEKLLEGVNLIPKEKENNEIFEIEETKPIYTNSNAEWLQEQVSLLSSENQNLKLQLASVKDDYTRILNEYQKFKTNGSNEYLNETITQNVLTLYNELQNNLMGHNQERTVWTTASIPHLLKKMSLMFPFTESIRKIK